jgi:hypothetical protein
MKAPKSLKPAIAITIAMFCMNLCYAQQLAFTSDQQPVNKINVQLKIKPTYPDFRISLQSLEEKEKVHLSICNAEERKLSIVLASEDQVLWSMATREAYFSRILNLSSLDDGTYYLKINNGLTKIEKKLVIQSKEKIEKDIRIQ